LPPVFAALSRFGRSGLPNHFATFAIARAFGLKFQKWLAFRDWRL
jgi:hypothetical protein